MRQRALALIVNLIVLAPACAQESSDGPIQQLSTTQAHLNGMRPPGQPPTPAGTRVLVRLLGKVLSEQFKDVRVELDSTPAPDQATALSEPGALHFNRRAEICFDNYRVGLRRDGLSVRYELTF